ncbi:MAG: hypothetical protein Q4C95_11450 [Planctomycetia bacterium]|nr:hypothetical protein [Planctomycetia bacterium]
MRSTTAGANSSGEAIQLRTSSGTSAIAAIDNAGARAIEEQLIFAAIWAGATRKEAGERISYLSDTSYLGTNFQLQSIVSLLEKNSQTGLLSNRNMYAIINKAVPGVLSSYDDNEVQKISDYQE